MITPPKDLVEFDELIEDDDGKPYRARVLGTETPLGHWEGWLEFSAPTNDRPTVSSGRETTQPNLADLGYWATGLTRVYLQGALRRALSRSRQTADKPARSAARTSEERTSERMQPPSAMTGGHFATKRRRSAPVPHGTPVLDPFAVYAQSEGILRQELRALSADHLRTIIDAYALESDVLPQQSASDVTRDALAERIVIAVKKLVATG